MTDDVHTDIAGPTSAASVLTDEVLKNPEVQVTVAVTVQRVAYILGGLAGLGIGGVFLLAGLGRAVPDTIVLLGSTVASACIGGLVGFIAGQWQGANNA